VQGDGDDDVSKEVSSTWSVPPEKVLQKTFALCVCIAPCRISKDVEVVVDPAGAPAASSTAAALSIEAADKGSRRQTKEEDSDGKKKKEEPEVKVNDKSLCLGIEQLLLMRSTCVVFTGAA
jgi:hypothetical protein